MPTKTTTQTDHDQILSVGNTCKLTTLSRVSVWQKRRAGDFPKAIKLSANRVGFKRSEVLAWIESRPRVA